MHDVKAKEGTQGAKGLSRIGGSGLGEKRG